MDWPKISVIVPSFNQAPYLEDTLMSVVRQEYPNLELIVIDGGSRDESVDIIRKLEKHITYWISEPDGGQTNGLIKGFNRSTGEIQCWLNSDDQHTEGCLHEVAKFFQQHPEIDVVFGNTLWIDKNGKALREQREIPFNRFIWLYTYNYLHGMSTFWRSKIYRQIGGLSPEFDLAMDADLWIRFSEVGRFAHVPRVWSKMRFYLGQKNQRLRRQSDLEDLRIRARYWGTDTPFFLGPKRFFAQGFRILWKLAAGCYPLGYRRNLHKQ